MSKRILITGVTGFVGPHLARFLLDKNDVILFGTSLNKHDNVPEGITCLPMNLTDSASVYETIAKSRPDIIFHLAAQSSVAYSWEKPAYTLDVNVLGTIHLFEAVRQLHLNPIIQIACSSEQYGLVSPEDLPVTEQTSFHPLSPYAVSRLTVDLMSYQYFKSYGLKTIRTRAFNHTGPGQLDQFVCSRFAKKIAEIEKGLEPPMLRVGNLDAIRDFTDVRDVVRAYSLCVEQGEPGEAYVIASGAGRTIANVLQMLLSLSTVTIQISTDPDLLRPSDVPVLYGDSQKCFQVTGWKPTITFEQTLSDLLNYWRKRV
jgi:GDP-4-dehydro-6-deoxy-D-mannose reductase